MAEEQKSREAWRKRHNTSVQAWGKYTIDLDKAWKKYVADRKAYDRAEYEWKNYKDYLRLNPGIPWPEKQVIPLEPGPGLPEYNPPSYPKIGFPKHNKVEDVKTGKLDCTVRLCRQPRGVSLVRSHALDG